MDHLKHNHLGLADLERDTMTLCLKREKARRAKRMEHQDFDLTFEEQINNAAYEYDRRFVDFSSDASLKRFDAFKAGAIWAEKKLKQKEKQNAKTK